MTKLIQVYNGDNYSSIQDAVADHADYECTVPASTPNEVIDTLARTISTMVWNDSTQVFVYVDGVALTKY